MVSEGYGYGNFPKNPIRGYVYYLKNKIKIRIMWTTETAASAQVQPSDGPPKST